MDHQTASGRRQLRKLAYAARGALRQPRSAIAFAGAALRSRQVHRRDLASVTLNWCYLLDVYRRAAATPGVHLLDQGLLQALWSLGYGARNPSTVLDDAPRMLPAVPQYIVASLRVKTEVALDRLQARTNGASRVDRELRAGRAEPALIRAKMMADAIDVLAARLASAEVLTFVQLDNQGLEMLGYNAFMLADRLTGTMTSSRPTPVSPAVRAR